MNKFKATNRSTLITCLLCAAFSAGSLAQQQDLIAQMDLDEDGMISIREAVANPTLLASFGKIDTDGDGKISAQELASTPIIKTEQKSAD